MLREIGQARKDGGSGSRRWFQDAYFDLYIWQDDGGKPIAFQLCYDRHRREGTIGWSAKTGYEHARVDDARMVAGPPKTPLLRAGPPPPYFRVYQRFLAAVQDWPESELAAFVLSHLRAFRGHLFGRRRPTRRPKASPEARSSRSR